MTAINLFAKVQGTGKPIIVLHGLFGSWENLGSIARQLAEDYEVHSLDLRNHGRSPHSDHMNYVLMSEDVLAYMDKHHIEKAHLLGHSMGGKTAMQLALNHPSRVDKLIVADIAPVKYPDRHQEIIKGLTSIDLNTLASRAAADKLLAEYVPEVPVRQFLLKNLQKNGADCFTWRLNLSGIIRNYDAITEGQKVTSQNNQEGTFLPKMLFIKGGHSDYITAKHQATVLKLFPNAVMRIIPETGHWLHAEKPSLFLQIVRRFLTDQL